MPFTYTPREIVHLCRLQRALDPIVNPPCEADPAYWRHQAEVEAPRKDIARFCAETADSLECGMTGGEELP